MPRSFDLGPHFERVLDDLVASGRFPTLDVAARVAIGLLEDVEAERAERLEALRQLIKEGEESGDAGEWDEDAFLNEAKARFASRAAAAE